MKQDTLKALIKEVLKEIGPDTIRAAGDKAYSMGKPAQADRFFSAVHQRSGTSPEKTLLAAIGNAPKTFKMHALAPTMGSGIIQVTLTGMQKKGADTYISFEGKGVLGMLKSKGVIQIKKKDGGAMEFFSKIKGEIGSWAEFDRNGAIAIHKLTGIPFSDIPVLDSLRESIRSLVLKEITMANYGIGKVSTNDELADDVKKFVGKAGKVIQNPLNNKVVVDDEQDGKKYQVDISESGEGLYNVNVITHGGERKTGRQLSPEKLAEFLKDSVIEQPSSVEKARTKSMNATGRNEKKDEKVEEKRDKKEEGEDEMVDTKEPTQKEIGDKHTKGADEKPDKELAPVDDENAAQLGGELADKIEKIIDRVLSKKVNKTGLES